MERRQVVLAVCVLLVALFGLVLGAESLYQRWFTTAVAPLSTIEVRQLSEQGVLITAVLPNTPAYDTILQRGDIILGVNGTPVTTVASLRQAITQRQTNEITLTVLQGNQRQTVIVSLTESDELGLHVDDGTIEATTPLQVNWVQVDGVEAGTPASLAGLQVGDIITIVAGEVILTPEELITVVQSKAVGDAVAVTVRRGGQTLTTNLTLTASPDDPQRPYMGIQLLP